MEHDWPWWIAGPAIGGLAALTTAITGKVVGISSAYSEACAPLARQLGGKPSAPSWKLLFAAGLPIGGALAALERGSLELQTSAAALERWLGLGSAAQLGLLFVGGGLVGLGARIAGGCTSGHSIVGLGQGARSSLVATIGFMAGGFAMAWVLQMTVGNDLGRTPGGMP